MLPKNIVSIARISNICEYWLTYPANNVEKTRSTATKGKPLLTEASKDVTFADALSYTSGIQRLNGNCAASIDKAAAKRTIARSKKLEKEETVKETICKVLV